MTRITLFCLTLALFTTSPLHAQPDSLWSQTYGTEGSDVCRAIVQTPDGGFALAGATRAFDRGDFLLVRTGFYGDTLWSHVYRGTGMEECVAMIQTADGGFALAGYTDSFGAGEYDFWLVRTDENGDSLWSRTYGLDGWEMCLSLVQTADGGFALAGFTDSYGAGHYDFWLVRTDEHGDSLWAYPYGGENWEMCYSLIQPEEGGFALAGYTDSQGAGDYDFWLARTDDDGQLIWYCTYGGEGKDNCYSLIETADGFALAGSTESYGAGGKDYWLVQTDRDGESLGTYSYGGRGVDICNSLIQTADGGFALAGQTASFGAGLSDYWLLQTDANGDSLWSRTYGGDLNEYCFSAIQTPDSGFALAGTTESFGAGDFDFWLLRCGPGNTLTGRVMENQDGSPISGAIVSIPELGLETATDSLGNFRLEKILRNTITLNIQAHGYTTVDQMEVAFQGQFELEIDIRVLHPELTLAPDSVAVSLPENSASETGVQISNPGDGLLEFYAVDDADWLEVTPTPAQVEPGASLDLTLAFNSNGLEGDSSYQAHVEFQHNTPVEGSIWLDVTMTVHPNSVGNEALPPLHFGLDAVYPNPFNSQAVSSYKLQVSSRVELSLYNLDGRLVQTLFEGWQEAGSHQAMIDGTQLPSGVYLLKLTAGRESAMIKAALLK